MGRGQGRGQGANGLGMCVRDGGGVRGVNALEMDIPLTH